VAYADIVYDGSGKVFPSGVYDGPGFLAPVDAPGLAGMVTGAAIWKYATTTTPVGAFVFSASALGWGAARTQQFRPQTAQAKIRKNLDAQAKLPKVGTVWEYVTH
jgi:hypothetical protein